MKYLKRFENNTSKYKVGKYIIIDRNIINIDIKIKNGSKIPSDSNIGKLFHVDKSYDENDCSFGINFSNGEKYYIKIGEIVRTASKKEIEQYRLEIDTNKYNL